jgi:uncharacterized protein (DUF608 family)
MPVSTIGGRIEEQRQSNAKAQPAQTRPFNAAYSGDYLDRFAFPLGGIGAGMFCIEGSGAFSHMSVRHKPDVFNEPGMFGAISIKGMQNGARVLEGPAPDWKKFGSRDSGNGLGGAIFGLPRFDDASITARFPFARLALRDGNFPLEAAVEAWSPFIPNDADNSSLPAAGIRYTLTNKSTQPIDSVFSFHSKNFLKSNEKGAKNAIGKFKNGFVLRQEGTSEKPFLKADFALFTDQPGTVVDHCWFRGGWFDSITMTWNTINNGEMREVAPVEAGAPGASLYVPVKLAGGEKKEIIVFATWYIPSSDVRFGPDVGDEPPCAPGTGCCNTSDELGEKIADASYTQGKYRPWYAGRFKDVDEVSTYFTSHYAELLKRTDQFTTAFFASSLPPEVTEAVAANLSILKSPTVLRQPDGRLWSFEGCGDDWGCCHGSCTHVWNYAQAIPHLFPALERTLRHTEFCESQNDEGHQTFRASLPIRPLKHDFHAAADGQLGGIMKVYREWRISGDTEWLKKMYPLVKSSIDYCQKTWDPKLKGVVEEPHHNTYDIEFWGPDGMCTSFYLGALSAMIEMGKFLKKKADVLHYTTLYDKGRSIIEHDLYDGEYFIQKIQTTGLNADPFAEGKKSMVGEYSEEAKALFQKEGPKYQYGKGCLSDGVLGAWIARMCGLPDPIDHAKIVSHLSAVHKYNFKSDLREHANPQRPSFAFGAEGGLLLCSWPKGGKLSLPFVYSDEVWTGIEYQVASHLMLTGKVDEGLEIVRACRNRYDGRIRNPFNEYECGHWYARALASYGLMQALTGVRYDAVDKTLHVDSKVGDFTTFLATNTGFGTVSWKAGKARVEVVEGKIEVLKLKVSGREVKM